MGLAVPLARRVAELRGSVAAPRDGGDTVVSAVAREASVTALERGETHYTDRPGIVPLRQRVAALMSERFGVAIDAGKGVVITCGVTEARFVAMQQLVPVGGTVVALSHGERIAGACIVRGAGLRAPDAAVDGEVTVYLTGDTPAEVRDPWLARAAERGWAVVYEPGDGSFHPATVGLAEQTVTIGAIGLDAGIEAWRVGYLAAPAATAGPLRDFKQALTLCTTNLSQWGALALLEEANA
jgi:aspartate/methionine/tyrosine aminotransferase